MKVVESMAINNVDINSFKQQLKGDGIQLVLILGKLFYQTCYSKTSLQNQWWIHPNLVPIQKYSFKTKWEILFMVFSRFIKKIKIETLPKEGPLISPLEPIPLEFKTTIKLSRAKWTPTPIIAKKKKTKTTLTTHLLQNEKHLI